MEYFVGPTLLTALGLGIAAAGLLLIFRALPPNRWFGLRTPRTAADPMAWYRAHRAMGWLFVVVGVAVAVLSMWPERPAHPALGLMGISVIAAATWWIYRRYAG